MVIELKTISHPQFLSRKNLQVRNNIKININTLSFKTSDGEIFIIDLKKQLSTGLYSSGNVGVESVSNGSENYNFERLTFENY